VVARGATKGIDAREADTRTGGVGSRKPGPRTLG
jgi:hypothetical protein